MMKTIDINQNSNLLLARDFNVFLDTNLEFGGENLSLKQKSIAKLIEIIEYFNLRNIWRIRNPKKKRFTSSTYIEGKKTKCFIFINLNCL